MSKRQKMRDRQRRAQNRNRLWVILFVAIGALLVAVVLILPNLGSPTSAK